MDMEAGVCGVTWEGGSGDLEQELVLEGLQQAAGSQGCKVQGWARQGPVLVSQLQGQQVGVGSRWPPP